MPDSNVCVSNYINFDNISNTTGWIAAPNHESASIVFYSRQSVIKLYTRFLCTSLNQRF